MTPNFPHRSQMLKLQNVERNKCFKHIIMQTSMDLDMRRTRSCIDLPVCRDDSLRDSFCFLGYRLKFIWENLLNEILISSETIFRHISFLKKQPGCKYRSTVIARHITGLRFSPRAMFIVINYAFLSSLPSVPTAISSSIIITANFSSKRFLQIACFLAWDVTMWLLILLRNRKVTLNEHVIAWQCMHNATKL